MEIKWYIKNFEELSKIELYEILKLRMRTFVVEQKCVYLDLDDMDQSAMHLFAMQKNNLIAYVRIQINKLESSAIIRRVIVHQDYRNKGLGITLMSRALEYIESFKKTSFVELSAQCHLQCFYEKMGFQIKGNPYSDTGILHIKMIKYYVKS
jgi:ElaA protein